MVPPTLGVGHDGDDRASLLRSPSRSSSQKAAESPPVAAFSEAAGVLVDKSDRAGVGAGALVRRPPRLHAPFVSPEFAGDLGRTMHLGTGVSRHYGLADGDDDGGVPSTLSIIREYNEDANRNSWWEQQPKGDDRRTPQAAPLYTVRAGDGSTRRASNSDVLVALPASPLPPSLKLAKRLAVNGMMSVLHGRDETRQTDFRLKAAAAAAAAEATPNTLPPQGEAESVMPQQQSRNPCKDLSPFVTEATCSWGQELGKILGQAVPDFAATATAVDSGTSTTAMVSSSLGGLGLTTTGLFPQTMHLRCDSVVLNTAVRDAW